MIVEKVFETKHQETETGLTAYVNSENEIYISTGSKILNSETGQPCFNGFTILDIDDAKALVIELQYLIKHIGNNIF